MTIKNLGGVFGRNPTFNDVTIEGQLTFDGDIDINSDLSVDGALDVTGLVTSEGLVHNGDSNTYVKFLPDRIYMDVGGNRGIDLEVNSTKIVNNGTVKLQTSSTDGLVVDANQDVQIPNGNIEMSSGHGIDFSASGTAGSELLDDYEEGTYTADLYEAGGSTLDAVTGYYTKVGNVVTIHVQSLGGATGGSGVVRSNLPFTSAHSASNTLAYSFSNGSAVACFVLNTGTYLEFVDTVGAIATGNKMIGSDISSSSRTYFSLTYITSD